MKKTLLAVSFFIIFAHFQAFSIAQISGIKITQLIFSQQTLPKNIDKNTKQAHKHKINYLVLNNNINKFSFQSAFKQSVENDSISTKGIWSLCLGIISLLFFLFGILLIDDAGGFLILLALLLSIPGVILGIFSIKSESEMIFGILGITFSLAIVGLLFWVFVNDF